MSATTSAADATRRYGPSAFGDDLRRFWNLTITLATTDFKLRYFGSVLGYFWSLARPLLFFGVLYVVFTQRVQLRQRRAALPGLPAELDRPVELLHRDDERLRAVPRSRARGCCARCASRGS